MHALVIDYTRLKDSLQDVYTVILSKDKEWDIKSMLLTQQIRPEQVEKLQSTVDMLKARDPQIYRGTEILRKVEDSIIDTTEENKRVDTADVKKNSLLHQILDETMNDDTNVAVCQPNWDISRQLSFGGPDKLVTNCNATN